MRSNLTKHYGQLFFQEMPEDELTANIDKFMIIKSGVHNEQQLADFMAKE
jgi:hypothetical protein